MTSISPKRDPKKDHLITPENSALIIIDYQPVQVQSVQSMNRKQLVENICAVAKIAKLYKLPILLSTVNVETDMNEDTTRDLKELLENIPSYDRTTINAWEDKEFNEAIKATGRKKLLMAALWTEACLSFPTLDALKEGYDVYPIVDAVGGTSKIAHKTALSRMQQAGAQLTSIVQVACELQRDWTRSEYVPDFIKIATETGMFFEP